MLLADKKVAIIGGGPVGLMMAKLLQQEGVNVHVYEWDAHPQARIMGGTLDIHKDLGQKALEKAGMIEAFYAVARPTGECIADINGQVINKDFPEESKLYFRPEIDRNDLRSLLLNHLEKETVIWDRKFLSLTKNGEQFNLLFEGNHVAAADIVIGANGGKSAIRTYVTNSTPQYTGTIIIQGEVFHPEINCPDFKQLCGETNLMVLDKQKMLFSQIKAGGAINYYISFRKPENWISENEFNFKTNIRTTGFLKRLLPDWHALYYQLFEATDNFTLLPMKVMPVADQWEHAGNITLIGDAAHVMPPFAGIGVNIGLLDALILAENLTSGSFMSIQEAIADYEKQMFVYASQAQRDTLNAETDIHSHKPVEEILQHRAQ